MEILIFIDRAISYTWFVSCPSLFGWLCYWAWWELFGPGWENGDDYDRDGSGNIILYCLVGLCLCVHAMIRGWQEIGNAYFALVAGMIGVQLIAIFAVLRNRERDIDDAAEEPVATAQKRLHRGKRLIGG